MNTPAKTSLEQEGGGGETVPRGRGLLEQTSKNVQNVLERRLATHEDIQDWFSHQGGYKKIQNLIKKLSTYLYVARYTNNDLGLPYILPEDEGELYRICTGTAPENLERIFHKIHNTLTKNKSDRLAWHMGKQELRGWYRTADESGKTGKEYIIGAIENHFGFAWKDTVLEINRKRKLQNKGSLGGTMSTIAKYCHKRINDLSDFFELLGETPEAARELAKRYENTPKGNRQEKPPGKTKAESRYSVGPKVKVQERIVHRNIQVSKIPDVSTPTLKDWEIDPREKERLGKQLARKVSRVNIQENKDMLSGFSKREERIGFSFFLRGLKHIGVPDGLLTEKYIRFSVDEKGDGIIGLHPIFFAEIGGDILSDLMERVMGSAEQALSISGIGNIELFIIPMQSENP